MMGEVQTIAQRKANPKPKTQNQVQGEVEAPAAVTSAIESHSQILEPAPRVNPSSAAPAQLGREQLAELAAAMGLEVREPKKLWIKHSYSITPEAKAKFNAVCETLGIKLQDGLDEALQDFFRKKESEFGRVTRAKGVGLR